MATTLGSYTVDIVNIRATEFNNNKAQFFTQLHDTNTPRSNRILHKIIKHCIKFCSHVDSLFVTANIRSLFLFTGTVPWFLCTICASRLGTSIFSQSEWRSVSPECRGTTSSTLYLPKLSGWRLLHALQ